MLKDRLRIEMVAALKVGDRKRVEVLRYLISLIDKRALQLPIDKMTELEEVQVLRKELKNKEEDREIFRKASRGDLVDQQEYEIVVLREYLPEEMGEEAISKIVEGVIGQKGSAKQNNFGAVMGEVMRQVAGRATGELVAKVVKEKLSE